MENELNIKNWDKLRADSDKEAVLIWSKITTVTINNDGFYTLDLLAYPAVKNAYL